VPTSLVLFLLLLAVALTAWAPPASATSKVDVVVIDNGDRLTGEIKGLERGRLSFKTTATDKIQVEWENVVSLTGYDYYAVQTAAGLDLFGAIRPDTTDSTRLVIWNLGGSASIRLLDMVSIKPVKKTFFGRIDGAIDFGFSFTQASKLLQYTLSSDATYRAEVFDTGYKLNSTLDVQGDETTSRNDLSFSFNRFFPGKKLATGRALLQSNRELGFDLRFVGSLGGGTYFWKDNHKVSSLVLGLSVNTEKPIDSDEIITNLEGLISGSFSLFYYQSPKRSIDFVINMYPGITDRDRFRMEANGKLRVEVISDFFIALSVLESYDSKPPAEGAAKNDLTLSTSLGYSF